MSKAKGADVAITGNAFAAQITLLEDLFEVSAVNPPCHHDQSWVNKHTDKKTGKVVECNHCVRMHRADVWPSKVSRVHCESENYEMNLQIDINLQLYPLQEHDRFTLVMATTLDLNGKVSDGVYDPDPEQATLADSYEYVMHGRCFSINTEDKDKMSVLFSYGGLLMRLRGDSRNLQGFVRDSDYFLLIRRA